MIFRPPLSIRWILYDNIIIRGHLVKRAIIIDIHIPIFRWSNPSGHRSILFVTSALTPDGGLINGLGELLQEKHLKAEQTFVCYRSLRTVTVLLPHWLEPFEGQGASMRTRIRQSSLAKFEHFKHDPHCTVKDLVLLQRAMNSMTCLNLMHKTNT